MSWVVEKRPPPASGKRRVRSLSGLLRKPISPRGVAILFLIRTVCAGQPGNLRIARPEGGVFHSQRIEETLLQKLFIRHATDDLDDACGDVHALSAVGILVAGLRLQWTGQGQRLEVLWERELDAKVMSGEAWE